MELPRPSAGRLRAFACGLRGRALTAALPAHTLVGLLAGASALHAAPKPAESADACVRVEAGVYLEAYGYRHVVALHNRCARRVSCRVWTDVDPEPRHEVNADAGETVAVITRAGSPAREFRAFRACSYP